MQAAGHQGSSPGQHLNVGSSFEVVELKSVFLAAKVLFQGHLCIGGRAKLRI